jgi:hypothetical protein
MSKDEIWLEHWMCVGRVSKKAQELVESVSGKVVYTSAFAGYSPSVALVCFLYSDPPDDDQGYSINDANPNILIIEASTADVHECNLIVYSTSQVPISEESVTRLVMVTLGEWYEITETEEERKRSNQQMRESYRAVLKDREKPWLPFDEDGE